MNGQVKCLCCGWQGTPNAAEWWCPKCGEASFEGADASAPAAPAAPKAAVTKRSMKKGKADDGDASVEGAGDATPSDAAAEGADASAPAAPAAPADPASGQKGD